jgi:large subunit ribosomal protein L18
MTKKVKKLYTQQKKRYLKKIVGNLEKPRLAVFRSHNHIYAQLIDDQTGTTLVASSTVTKNIQLADISTATQKAAYLVGQDLAKKAIQKEIKSVVFDRGEKPYQGRIKNLAEGARADGLIF